MGIFFKLLTFAYITFLILMVFEWRGDGDIIAAGKHTALVDLDGVIDAKGDASAEKINSSLDSAFKDKDTKGVILRINSPGGSPVQSAIINDEVRRLRGIYPNIPLYVVVEDICASGGYFVAASADNIYVNKASLVGSIGVLMDDSASPAVWKSWGWSGACSPPARTRASWIRFSGGSEAERVCAEHAG